MEEEGVWKDIGLVGEPLVKGGEEGRGNVGAIGGDVGEEAVDQLVET